MNLPTYQSKNHPLFNCGNPNCPICSRAYSFLKIKKQISKLKNNFSTDGVSPFVGRFNYPNINVSILTPPQHEENSYEYDQPRLWAEKEYPLPKIIDFRSSLIGSRTKLNIKTKDKFLELNKEVAMALRPVDVEINLKSKPKLSMNFETQISPLGPRAELKKATLQENPKIHKKVEYVYDDIHLKATKAINLLYKKNFDENFISRILSVGTLGLKKNRKLVPTRWSITATDDTIGKNLIKKVRDNNQINFQTYFGNYLGNHYLILCFPDVWSYELFEMHVSNINHYSTDYETYAGRKYYAASTAGGYYTVRLAILEHLNKIKRQGTILALRFITGDYTIPLGVFVTREAARKTMTKKPIEFASSDLMLKYAKNLIKKKFNINIETILNKSILLKQQKTQIKLTSF